MLLQLGKDEKVALGTKDEVEETTRNCEE